MSNSLFPQNLPGFDVKVERKVEWPTTIHTSNSGKEVRVSWQSSPVIRYVVTFDILRSAVNAPAPNQAFTELGLIEAFYATHKGTWDSFLFDDPQDGQQRRVRFDGALTYERIADGVWTVKKCELRTVV